MNHGSLLPGNRNSTPEASSSLRPPSQRSQMTSGHHLRSSADMGGISNPSTSRDIRPASEVLYNQHQRGQSHGNPRDTMDQATQKWIADIDQCETTLEEMAAATLDQDFKDELAAIEQWFKVLSEAERTAALYALLQQTTQVQIRFFIGVLQQMAKSHPMSGVLSPSSFSERDPMAVRLSTAMSKLNVDSSRNSLGPGGRVPPSPGIKRNSGLDQDQINAMFPEAAAALAQQKKDFTNQTGNIHTTNRNSGVVGDRSSLTAPAISAPQENPRDNFASPISPSPWGTSTRSNDAANRPKSSSGQQPMGQFSQPQSSSGLRASRPTPLSQDPNNNHHVPLNPVDSNGMPLLSPYTAGGNWASMVNTPMVPSFNQQNSQADMVANATAMKLAAMSTVNNRVQLDDARKYRRARSTEGRNQPPLSAGLPPMGLQNFPMTDQLGQILSPQQAAALQAQQLAALQGRRSRPTSPGLTIPGQGLSDINYAGTQQNGFLSAYNSNNLGGALGGLSLGPFGGLGSEGYLSDASEIQRGRSPRGRRGTSRPPEDPTDPQLLADIPQWLRTLRLHKYTDNLKDLKWQDLVKLDDKGLEDRGVAAVGARRKLLKVFEEVREAQAKGKV